MARTYGEVIAALRRDGWVHVHTTGSHMIWRHPEKGQVTIAAGGKLGRSVAHGTLVRIRKVTGLDDLR